jgi:hypothetical protein
MEYNTAMPYIARIRCRIATTASEGALPDIPARNPRCSRPCLHNRKLQQIRQRAGVPSRERPLPCRLYGPLRRPFLELRLLCFRSHLHACPRVSTPTHPASPKAQTLTNPVSLYDRNVDRLIAMYQAIYPSTWLEPASSTNTGNFWIPNNSQLTPTTPMPPFWKDDQSFYTPDEIRNISILGYAYPETQYWNFPTLEQWRLSVNSTIAYRYSSSARNTLTQRSAKGDAGLSHLLTDGTFTDWTVKSKVALSKLPSTFYVVFSFRNTSASDAGYQVGTWTRQRTGQPDTTHAAQQSTNRAAETQLDGENTMSLTSSLLDRIAVGDLKSLDAKDVVPYIKGHLTWQVKTVSFIMPLRLYEAVTVSNCF